MKVHWAPATAGSRECEGLRIHLATVQHGKKWHRSLRKVFLAILVLFASFLKSPVQLHMRISSLEGVGDGVVVGGSGQARHERFQFDIAPRKKAEKLARN